MVDLPDASLAWPGVSHVTRQCWSLLVCEGITREGNEVLSAFNKLPPSDLADLGNIPQVDQRQLPREAIPTVPVHSTRGREVGARASGIRMSSIDSR